MYIPAHFAPDDETVTDLLRNHGAGDLVTPTDNGLVATMLPFVYVPPSAAPATNGHGSGEHGTGASEHGSGGRGAGTGEHAAGALGALHGHVARNNDHWKAIGQGGTARAESLAIVRGPDAYISPGWYASKAEHGRVVPTWNYVTAHVYGTLVVHDDAEWKEDLVRRLTVKHESKRDQPWSVDDAPRAFVEGQLRAIVGIELLITRIEAKAKLSQNRPEADVAGVIAGLRDERDDSVMSDAVERANSDR